MFGRKKNDISSLIGRAIKPASTAPARAPKRPQEYRHTVRTNTWQQCVLSSDSGYRVAGIVLDHSHTGARVRFRSHEMLPECVTIIVAGLQIKAQARVVWQDKGDAGLMYI